MATDVLTSDVPDDSPPAPQHHRRIQSAQQSAFQTILAPLASLKLTVALFGLAIFLVFAGTLAQASHDVWWVLHNYFRSPLAWIDFQVFFPPAWFPSWQHIPRRFLFPRRLHHRRADGAESADRARLAIQNSIRTGRDCGAAWR